MSANFMEFYYAPINKKTTSFYAIGIADCGHRFFIKTDYDNEYVKENKEIIEKIGMESIKNYPGIEDCYLCKKEKE